MWILHDHAISEFMMLDRALTNCTNWNSLTLINGICTCVSWDYISGNSGFALPKFMLNMFSLLPKLCWHYSTI